jgi:hypothetical protein
MVRHATVPLKYIMKYQPPARSGHPVDFLTQTVYIGDSHPDIPGPDHVKGSIGKRQGQCTAMLDSNTSGQADKIRQLPGFMP